MKARDARANSIDKNDSKKEFCNCECLTEKKKRSQSKAAEYVGIYCGPWKINSCCIQDQVGNKKCKESMKPRVSFLIQQIYWPYFSQT